MKILIRKAVESDVAVIAHIHRQAFPRQRDSEKWVSATLAAEPRFFVFVAKVESVIVGYIFWAQKSGFRAEPVLELDQVAMLDAYRGKGYAEKLIRDSLAAIETELRCSDQTLKAVLVSTRSDNKAQRLYTKVLGVEIVATIDELYSATEVIMLSKR